VISPGESPTLSPKSSWLKIDQNVIANAACAALVGEGETGVSSFFNQPNSLKELKLFFGYESPI